MYRGQSVLQSWVETAVNIAVGLLIGFASQRIVFPWFGIHLAIADNLRISAIFTVTAVVRGFVLRRAFNAFHVWQISRATQI